MEATQNQTVEPFHFFTRVHLTELTGLKAYTLEDLLSHIRTVPGSVIYSHTHRYLQQHQYLSPEPPNDFAYWVREALGEEALGEQLVSINTCEYSTIRALREKIAATLETYLTKGKGKSKRADDGDEFYFLKSISFVFPTPYEVNNLAEFVEVFKKITVHSIYFHMFEARLRLEKGTNDFSWWLETSLGEGELAKKISRLDPYTHTMEGLRKRIIQLAEKRLSEKS